MSTEISVAVRRAVIETNLEQCRDTAARNLVEIGRWLNAAKDEGVVPHGEWTAWVQRHAGMNERTAQRCMQAARELPAGSALEGLGMTKIRALLTLPAQEREEAALDMDAAHRSSAEVERAVAERNAARRDRDEALRLVEQQKKRILLLQERQREAVDAAVKDAICAEREEAEGELESLRGTLLEVESERVRLTAQLEEARAGGGETDAARKEMETLRRANEKAEAEIDRLTELLDEAQTAAARGGMREEMVCSPVTRITTAIGGLMAQAGRAPGELTRMAGELPQEDRDILIGQARTIGQWAMSIIAVCGGEVSGV